MAGMTAARRQAFKAFLGMKIIKDTYQLVGLALEGNRAEDDLAVDAVPPVARRHPLHEHVVRQRRQERCPSKHLAQESDRLHDFDSCYLGYVKHFQYETF